ncbi:unnamed protein product [Closterium sp. NIES-64]|nr:unnamed protein product [Closterium sp. NIES-64]
MGCSAQVRGADLRADLGWQAAAGAAVCVLWAQRSGAAGAREKWCFGRKGEVVLRVQGRRGAVGAREKWCCGRKGEVVLRAQGRRGAVGAREKRCCRRKGEGVLWAQGRRGAAAESTKAGLAGAVAGTGAGM